MNAAQLLENLNLLDEHEKIEAKRASEAGKSILETICALANEPDLGAVGCYWVSYGRKWHFSRATRSRE